MENLPLELFYLVFDNITEIRDLLQIRAVNKIYHAEFTPRAFKEIAFESGPNGLKRFNDIASSGLIEWINGISFEICLEQSCDLPEGRYPIAPIGSNERSISRFTKLQRISVYFPGPSNCGACHFQFQNMMFKELIESPSTVHSLTITNLRPSEEVRSYIRRPEFQSLLSRLTHLSIGFAEGETVGTGVFQEFLQATQANLESLVLKSHSWVSEFPTSLEFNSLKKLNLQRFILSGSKYPVTKTFTSKPVASTLREIHLSHIAVCFRQQRSQTVQTGAYSSAGAEILLAFQERLKALKRFEVEHGFEYVEIDENSRYTSFIPESKDLLADKKALNALWECIGQKRRMKLEETYNDNRKGGGNV